MLTVGDPFPLFNSKACVSNEKNGFIEINNSTYPGKWAVYFFYPKDFTFICPTELVDFAKKTVEFADRDAVLITGSTDNEYSHQAWRKSHADLTSLPYPMLAAQKLAGDLGIIDPVENVCLRIDVHRRSAGSHPVGGGVSAERGPQRERDDPRARRDPVGRALPVQLGEGEADSQSVTRFQAQG